MMREKVGTALGGERGSIIAARQSQNTGTAGIGLGEPERELIGFGAGRKKNAFFETPGSYLRELVAGLQDRRGKELRPGVQQRRGLARNAFDELRMVMTENATKHTGRQVQELLAVGIAYRRAAPLDQHFVGVGHGHQHVIAVAPPILQVGQLGCVLSSLKQLIKHSCHERCRSLSIGRLANLPPFAGSIPHLSHSAAEPFAKSTKTTAGIPLTFGFGIPEPPVICRTRSKKPS